MPLASAWSSVLKTRQSKHTINYITPSFSLLSRGRFYWEKLLDHKRREEEDTLGMPSHQPTVSDCWTDHWWNGKDRSSRVIILHDAEHSFQQHTIYITKQMEMAMAALRSNFSTSCIGSAALKDVQAIARCANDQAYFTVAVIECGEFV